MKLRSFGCSFVYGSDLSDTSQSWPSLMADRLNLEYHCHARPGSGNLQIMESILRNCDRDCLAIINWTWIDRFDYVDTAHEDWETLRPVLDRPQGHWYFKNIHSQYRDMLTNLCYIKIAVDFLCSNGIKFIMSYMDDLLLEKVQKEWHDPKAVEYLQKYISPHLQQFDGSNFLDWSKAHGFPISDKWHPLEQAHQSAADFWCPVVLKLIHN